MLPRSDRNWVEGLRRDGSVILSVRVFSRKKIRLQYPEMGSSSKMCLSALPSLWLPLPSPDLSAIPTRSILQPSGTCPLDSWMKEKLPSETH